MEDRGSMIDYNGQRIEDRGWGLKVDIDLERKTSRSILRIGVERGREIKIDMQIGIGLGIGVWIGIGIGIGAAIGNRE